MADRIAHIRTLLAGHRAEGALITFLPDIRWATGFTGSNGVLWIGPGGAHFISDGRYEAQARREVHHAAVHIPGYDLLGYAAEAGILTAAGRVVLQAEHVTLSQLERLQTLFPSVEWVPVAQLLVGLVASKDAREIAKIEAAQRITDAVFEHIVGELRPGIAEREVAAEIVYQHLRRGAERMSFEPIVASGPQGAFPHARATARKLAPGDVVVLDFGCFHDGYASDMTRTVALGEPGEEARAVYDLVRAGQEAALAAARAGMPSKELDQAARGVIERGGYGPYFSHGLGHGVGLQIHEWPRVSYNTDELLPEGAVVTIEPGVYLPDKFGVRIEDLVVLERDGCRNLTRSPKELLVL